MSYCLNSNCFEPQNVTNVRNCASCGKPLLLKERYRALKPIGSGAFGKTFLGVDEDLPFKPRRVIKQFSSDASLGSNRQKAKDLFEREAVQLYQLGKHPQIPELFAHFEQDGQLYLVQEFIDGQNLAEELATEGCFSEAKIRQILESVLPILKFVHKNQVIHRDIKPENLIRRSEDQQIVLVDFGAAKLATGSVLFKTGTMIGTPEYVAPEQLAGRAIFASDLYGLGTTCLRLLTQMSPFDLFDTSQNRWTWQSAPIQPISSRLAAILDRLIEPATNHRYASADQVLTDLTAGIKPSDSYPQVFIPNSVHNAPLTKSETTNLTLSPNNWEPLIMGKKWGFEDREGSIKIEPAFEYIYRFKEGLAAVQYGGKWGFITPTGGFYIQPVFKGVQSFSEGLAAVRHKGKWGFINQTGEWVIPAQYQRVLSFSEGLAAVETPDARFGYVNRSGHFTEITTEYAGHPIESMPEVCLNTSEKRYCFCEGLAAVRIGGKWGFINLSGDVIIPPMFEDASGFSEGLAPVQIRQNTKHNGLLGVFGVRKKQKQWGFVNKYGEFEIEPQFLWAGRFKHDVAKVIYPNRSLPHQLDERLYRDMGDFRTIETKYVDNFWRKQELKGAIYLWMRCLVWGIRTYIFSLYTIGVASTGATVALVVAVVRALNGAIIAESLLLTVGVGIASYLLPYLGMMSILVLVLSILVPILIKVDVSTISLSAKTDIASGVLQRWAIGCTGKHLINKRGDLVRDFEFVKGSQFQDGYDEKPEGLVPFRSKGKFGYMNGDTGEIIISPKYSYAGPFQHGLACISFDKSFFELGGSKYGSINIHGKVVIPPQMDLPYLFEDGLAVVKIAGKYGLINRSGHFIVEPKYYKIRRDSSHKVSFVGKRSVIEYLIPFWGICLLGKSSYELIDDFGSKISSITFNECRDFWEGLAPVKIRKKWGFINTKGELEIYPQYKDVRYFHNGLAAVKVGSKWGYIDTNGEIVIKPQFYSAEPFFGKNRLAAVKVGSKWGYIDTNGEIVIRPQFYSARSFLGNTTEVRAFGFLGLPGRKLRIDRSGNRLFKSAD